MTSRRLRDYLEVKLSSKMKKTQNILSSDKKGDKEKMEEIKMKEMKPYLRGSSILPLSKALLHDPGGSVLSVKMIRTLLPKVPVKESQVMSQEIGGSHESQDWQWSDQDVKSINSCTE